MDEFCGSTFWDWDLTWNTTDSPDFTPCFERTVLYSIPCLFLWIFTPVDILLSHHSNSRQVPWSPLMSAKVAFNIGTTLLEIGLFLVEVVILPASIENHVVYPVDIYVPAVRVATLILSMGLLMYSRKRGVRSSGVQFLFWLFVTIVQAIRFRTVILSGQDSVTGNSLNPTIFIMEVIYFPVVVGQLILHSWADMAPVYQSEFENPSEKNPSPETRSSFLSKILFEWYTPLIWTGFRKPLEYYDLWNLNWDLRSQSAVANFDKYWPKNLNTGCHVPRKDKPKKKLNLSSSSSLQKTASSKKDGNINGSIFQTWLKTFGSNIVFGLLIRIVPDLMILIQPLILNQLIAFVSSDEPTWKGIMYAVILMLSALIAVIFAANGIHIFFQIGIRFKSALVSAIYRKSLLLSNSAKREKSTGEIVNHMAVDVGYVSDIAQNINHVFSSPIVMGVCLYSLWNILGIAALAGIVVMVLILPLNAFIARIGQKLQKELMGYKDKRTKMMSEILNGIKCIKLYAWEPSFEKQVMEIRAKELRVLKHIACWNALSNFLWTCSPILVATASFGTYVLIDSKNVLDAQTAFVSISLFNIMAQPLAIMPILINMYIQASVGFKRLNGYLNADEVDTEAVSHDLNEKNPVVIENASFSWDEDARAGGTLHNINLQVKQGELVAIVGPVGCGKSSLLSSLLNELVKTAGRVNIRGRIAYVAQIAWIQNATVRDNILFGSPYDSNKYKKVIDACALTPDLEILPAGDKTEIGEKGINLSGGQKQRVSLARAVYSNADIYLLDDPLSAVDAKVGKHIFDRVLGPKGILRGKTRLLVTHGIVHLPAMDNIVVMMDGKISEIGTYQFLQDKNGAFSDFLKQHTNQQENSSSQEKDAQTEARLLRQRLSSSRTMSVDSESEVNGSVRMRRFSSKTSLASNNSQKQEANKLIEVEKMETTSVKRSVYLDYFRAAGWNMVGATMLMYVGFQGFSVGGNLWLSEWTAVSPKNSTTADDQHQNGYYFSIYGVLGLLQAASVLSGSIIMAMGTLKSANVLHLGMLTGILRAPVQFFDVTPLGRILNRFSKDVDSLDSTLPVFLRHWTNAIFYVFGVLITISISTPLFTVVILPVALFYYCLQRIFVATSRQLKRLESTTKSPIYSHFGETVAGASTIRAYAQQERFILESEQRQDHNMMSYYSMMSSNRWLQIRLELVGSTVVFFAALLAVLGRDTLSAGMVGMSISSGMYFTNCLLSLVRFTSDVETNIVAVERMKEYGECPQEAAWEHVSMKPPSQWPQSGAIVFDQYKTRYRAGLELVLKNVSCSINPGEKVGIVGRTGAGKSSVTLAIFRILEATEGSILVDGKDISRLGLHDVRGRFTIIPQDPMLFSASLKMNLDPFGEKRDDELWMALELAHLKGFVDGLPGGLNFEVTEGGENLSVGQRQLVCLARALLRRTKILVLDEATSAVDLDTEELILRTIRSEFKDSTVITIAHRLNTIMDSDRVIVLEKGQVVEVDTPNNFLANKKSLFYAMAKEAGLTEGNNGLAKS